jgi:hypothetical protein
VARRRGAILGIAMGLAACSPAAPPDEIVAPTRSPSPTSPVATATPEEPGAPSPVTPEHGGTYWAVYLAVGEGPELEDAIAYLTEERGVEFFGPTDVNCDQGAVEALGSRAGPLSVAVYFDTEEDARAWAETLPGPPVGVAEVRTFCLD